MLTVKLYKEVIIFFILSLDIIQLLGLRQSDSKGFLG